MIEIKVENALNQSDSKELHTSPDWKVINNDKWTTPEFIHTNQKICDRNNLIKNEIDEQCKT